MQYQYVKTINWLKYSVFYVWAKLLIAKYI